MKRYFYSDAVGLGANAVSALLVSLICFGAHIPPQAVGTLVLVIGGVLQLACAVRSARAHEHFALAVFGTFSVMWATSGLTILTGSHTHLSSYVFVAASITVGFVGLLVNAFYPCIVGVITLFLALDLGVRDSNTAPQSAFAIVDGVAGLAVVAVAAYGVVAAVLKGVHERQVLKGFDDAVIESILWKRPPLVAAYSGGRWANPKPLLDVLLALGSVGMAARLYPTHQLSSSAAVGWLSTVATVLCVVCLLHSCRKEVHLATLSFVSALAFVAASANGAFVVPSTAEGLALLGCGLLEALQLGLAHPDETAGGLAARSLLTLALVVDGADAIGARPPAGNAAAAAVYLAAAALWLFLFAADLANVVAQKILIPTGPTLQRLQSLALVALARPAPPGAAVTPSTSSSQSTSQPINTDMHKASSSHHVDEASELLPNTAARVQSLVLPGDAKLLGQSDLSSPLFALLSGTALNAWAMCSMIFVESLALANVGALVGLVALGLTSCMCALRGQTSFGFLSVSFAVSSFIWLVCLQGSQRGDELGGCVLAPMSVLVLQLPWLMASWHAFRPLSVQVALHVAASACLTAVTIGGQAGAHVGTGEWLTSSRTAGWQSGLMWTAAILFAMQAAGTTALLALLLGAERGSEHCRRMLYVSAKSEGPGCPMGFAAHRGEFDRAVSILREGGVVCIPTDTVYCLACAASKPEAIKRIYAAKQRPAEKPLSLWLGSIEDIKNLGPQGKGWGSKLVSFMEVSPLRS